MPRNAQLDSAGRLLLKELLASPAEGRQLLAEARKEFPAEQPARGAELTKKQRQWLVQQVQLGLENLGGPVRGPKRGQNEVRTRSESCP